MNLDFSYLAADGISECGPYRDHNEDALLLLPEEGCFFVADGMGGHEAGEVASGMLLDMLRQELSCSRNNSPGNRKQLVTATVQKANKAIFDYSLEHGFTKGMGSTLVGVIFDSWHPELVYICHAGDSRAYLYRKGTVKQLTQDHTSALRKHAITRAIGPKESVELEWNVFRLEPEDCLILCSDGVSGCFETGDFEAMIRLSDGNCHDLVREMILEAIARESHDNVTAIAISLPSLLPPSVTVSEAMEQESNRLLGLDEVVANH